MLLSITYNHIDTITCDLVNRLRFRNFIKRTHLGSRIHKLCSFCILRRESIVLLNHRNVCVTSVREPRLQIETVSRTEHRTREIIQTSNPFEQNVFSLLSNFPKQGHCWYKLDCGGNIFLQNFTNNREFIILLYLFRCRIFSLYV